jgi:hypothetical protein
MFMGDLTLEAKAGVEIVTAGFALAVTVSVFCA